MPNLVKHLLEFGPFRLDPEQRLLLRDEQSISLSPKAFDLLLVLIQHSGQVVLKDDLMKQLWPDTFVEESNLGQHVFQLRKALGDRSQDSTYIVTVPGRGYRFAQKVHTAAAEPAEVEESGIVVESHTRSTVLIEKEALVTRAIPGTAHRLRIALGSVVIVGLLIAAVAYRHYPLSPKLTVKDTVVLADFANSTGDAVFDGALRQALAAQLEQSPFLNLLSDRRIAETLALMTQQKDSRLIPELAREICQRTASAAVLNGSITQIGARYLLTLKAVNCATGESLASTQAQAKDKNEVLDALGKVASEIRSRLGESLASVQKYDVPPENVTTSSLEALKSFSIGIQLRQHDLSPAIPFFERAIRLDPNFATAYAQLGVIFFNLDDTAKAADYFRRAYDLRDRVSEAERLKIASGYEIIVTRNLEAARKTFQVSQQIYPRVGSAFGDLGTLDIYLGKWDEVLTMTQKGAEVSQRPYNPNLVSAYIYLNRLDEAKKLLSVVQSSGHDSPAFGGSKYAIAFLEGDQAGMDRALADLIGKPGWENTAFYSQSSTAAYHGCFAQARERIARAADSATRTDNKAIAAAYRAAQSVREALVGNYGLAQQEAKASLAASNTREVEAVAAIALADSGESAEALRVADDLARKYPEDTIVHVNFSPDIRAAVALKANHADKAIEELLPSVPYELGSPDLGLDFALYPVYFRGQAYLMKKDGKAAAAEFQKILDHPGVVQNEIIAALAHLGLGRAYALSNDSPMAKTEYQNFLSLWKNADPDIPTLKQAKAEYAKLK
jgi:eukaryotic-like serine/threonine-protein kinase